MKTNYLACSSPSCKKTFRNMQSLEKHLEEDHTESENGSVIGYRCKKCKKVLGTKQCLKEHLYTHTGQRPYKCNEPGCKKIFRHSSQLSYHKKMHFELKKYLKVSENIEENFKSGNCQNFSAYFGNNNCELPMITTPQYEVKLPTISERFRLI